METNSGVQIALHIEENLYFWEAINQKNPSRMERIIFHSQIYRSWFIRIVAILLITIMHLPIKAEARLAPDSLYRQLQTAEVKERVLILQALVRGLNVVDSMPAFCFFYEAAELA